jgi:nucleotidyltransferase substrate binding protein (TIGR01987 family)
MGTGFETSDIRWRQRFQNYRKALAQLGKAIELARQRPLSVLEQQGLIQSFEYTHELAWKTLKDLLESRGTSGLYGSRDVTRQAFALGLVHQGEIWMEMIQSRNQTTHLYDEALVSQIALKIESAYGPLLFELEQTLAGLLPGEGQA